MPPWTTLKRFFRLLGVEVQHARNALIDEVVVADVLERLEPDLVIDVGASRGQFVEVVRGAGYGGRILSIEPQPEPHARLMALAAADPLLIVPLPACISDQQGTTQLFVSANSASSSTKRMLPRHQEAAPESRVVNTVEVPRTTLDSLLETVQGPSARPYIKVDTQGAELDVLRGSANVLRRAVGVQIELSLEPLYEGQPKVSEIVMLLSMAGLELSAFIPGFRDPRSHRLLQLDAIFTRSTGS